MRHVFAKSSAAAAVLLVGVGSAAAQNLLVNPSFENGLTGWTVVQSTPTVVSYGAIDVPGLGVASRIGGGSNLLRDGNNAVVEQVVSVPAGVNVRVGGFLGGSDADGAKLVIRFLNASNAQLALLPLDAVTPSSRNFETVLMIRETIVTTPPGTAKVAARIEFQNACCGSAYGAADAIFVEPTGDPVIPPPFAAGAELLVNGDFEDGWALSSPLTLVDAQG